MRSFVNRLICLLLVAGHMCAVMIPWLMCARVDGATSIQSSLVQCCEAEAGRTSPESESPDPAGESCEDCIDTLIPPPSSSRPSVCPSVELVDALQYVLPVSTLVFCIPTPALAAYQGHLSVPPRHQGTLATLASIVIRC
jgi:hypothetical protein